MILDWYELILGNENRVDDPLVVAAGDYCDFDEVDLKLGVRVEEWETRCEMRPDDPEDDGWPDDLLANEFGLPILSPGLVEALAGAGVATNDIQFLPVRVFRRSGSELPGFRIANIVARVPALDRERSTMLDVDETEIDPLTDMPRVRGVWTAALKRAALCEHDVVRLVEFFPTIFVSRRFADVFFGGKFTGATLHSVPVS